MSHGHARIRLMTPGDLPAAMRLSREAGWNQVEADWRRFRDMQPDGCFVAELAQGCVGTVVACVFDQVAWIAMLLVDSAQRGEGIGRALIEHALMFLDEQGRSRRYRTYDSSTYADEWKFLAPPPPRAR